MKLELVQIGVRSANRGAKRINGCAVGLPVFAEIRLSIADATAGQAAQMFDPAAQHPHSGKPQLPQGMMPCWTNFSRNPQSIEADIEDAKRVYRALGSLRVAYINTEGIYRLLPQINLLSGGQQALYDIGLRFFRQMQQAFGQ